MGENRPGGRLDRVPREHRGTHPVTLDKPVAPLSDAEIEREFLVSFGVNTFENAAKKKYPNVTDRSIDPNPDHIEQNPILEMDGGVPVRNQGYKPGSVVVDSPPAIRFATKPRTDWSEGVVNWFVQKLAGGENKLVTGTGTVSTKIVPGRTFISKKDGEGKNYKLTVFRVQDIVR